MKESIYQEQLRSKIELKKKRLKGLDDEMNRRLREINSQIRKIMKGHHPSEVFGGHPSLNQRRTNPILASQVRSLQNMFDQVKQSYREEEKALEFEIKELKQKYNDSQSPIFNRSDLLQENTDISNECFFISYKSENVIVARNLAEGLMILGYRVWFAEYRILNEKFFNFEGELSKGVKEATKAICIVNEEYSKSTYCVDHELKPLLESEGVGPENIFMITTQDEPIQNDQFPTFEPAAKVVWGGVYKDVFKALLDSGFINREPSNYLDYQHSTSFKRFKFDDLRIAFDSSGWRPLRRGKGNRTYIRKMGDLDLGIHVNWHMLIDQDKEVERFNSTGIDDREIFEFNIKGTKKYISKSKRWFNKIEPIGVHLFFLFGYSQYAITYKIRGLFSTFFAPMILRKYIVTFPSSEGKKLEMVFTCRIKFTKRSDLRELLQYLPVFDEFILSGDKY